MTERWISQSENLLKVLERRVSKEERDRLEIVNSMILALNTLDRSVHGWKSWVRSLPLMSRFTEEELEEMEEGLIKSVRAFVEYDIQVTERHQSKIPQTTQSKEEREAAGGLYV